MKAIQAVICTWVPRAGKGICKTQSGCELSVNENSLHPRLHSSEDLKGEKLYIVAFERGHIRPKVVSGLWGTPKTAKVEIKRVYPSGSILVKDVESSIDGWAVGTSSDLLALIELGTLWQAFEYGDVFVLDRQVLTRKENEARKIENRNVSILQSYNIWIENATSRRNAHKSIEEILPQNLKVEFSRYEVKVAGKWLPTDICRITSTIYAQAQYEKYKSYEEITGHYGDESWGTGNYAWITHERLVSPERAFNMPEALCAQAIPIYATITKVAYCNYKGDRTTICALSDSGLAAIWSCNKMCWSVSSAVAKIKYGAVVNFNDHSLHSKMYFPLVYMAKKQGMNLGNLVSWLPKG